ncbi:hypothetical protein GCM10007301_24560 [Azorhizobium oxalatiphilum]|uniref:Uncharacterized protein n=1 Tax=Azorhizobium oxalatiphilum TaxID=980631 RepID=A0A917FA62_9HYPH|nr:hypothetical protein [Azorhizobium oxalatiphilum]GGF63855.1 hypothetical protein GCM10007301_24560 [Azorhizobium oxalatiphilum]
MIISSMQTIVDGFVWGLVTLAFLAPVVAGLLVLGRISGVLDDVADDEEKDATSPKVDRLALTPLPYRYVWRGCYEGQGRT